MIQLDFCRKTNLVPYNTKIAVLLSMSLENKFLKKPEFCKNYQQTIESFKNGYATKLNPKYIMKTMK